MITERVVPLPDNVFRYTVSAAEARLGTAGRPDQCGFSAVFSAFGGHYPGVSHFTADLTSWRTWESSLAASPCLGGRYGPPYKPQ